MEIGEELDKAEKDGRITKKEIKKVREELEDAISEVDETRLKQMMEKMGID